MVIIVFKSAFNIQTSSKSPVHSTWDVGAELVSGLLHSNFKNSMNHLNSFKMIRLITQENMKMLSYISLSLCKIIDWQELDLSPKSKMVNGVWLTNGLRDEMVNRPRQAAMFPGPLSPGLIGEFFFFF